MDKNKDKKQTYVPRVLMMISTVVLIILFFATMSMVGKIQGTALRGQLCRAGTWKDAAYH